MTRPATLLRAALPSLLLALLTLPVAAQELLHELMSPKANEQEYGNFGQSVAGVGDVDGDGRSDLLVGAYGDYPTTSPPDAGRAYVFSGATGELLHILVSPSEEEEGYFGVDVAGVADVDGDGMADLLVGAYAESPGGVGGAGRVYLFSGATGAPLLALVSPNAEESGLFGGSVSGVEDLDGDGVGDLLVGAFGEAGYAGRAYVFSGATGELLHVVESPNEEQGGHFGLPVSGVGDVDGDGIGDLLIGALRENPGTSPVSAGRAYVFSGATGALLHELTSPNEEEQGTFGNSASGVGDVDGDGRADLLVGAPFEDPATSPEGAGRAYLFSGATGVLLHTLASPNGQTYGAFGYSTSGVPDLDGDGRGDLLVGAYREGPDQSPLSAGRAYLFSGATGALLFELASPNEEWYGNFGWSVSGVGDVDGDGRGDLLIGADGESSGTTPSKAGRAYVFSGAGSGVLAVDVAPVSAPVVIPATGGSFGYTVTATNGTAQAQTIQLWTRVTKPNGQQTGALRGPITRTLDPGVSVTDELMQSVPGRIAPGVYTYTAYVGTYPDEVIASDGFTFTKEGAALAARKIDDVALWQEVAEPSAEASAAGETPGVLALSSARPNPFADRTTLAFDLPEPVPVRLSVFDALGREVAVLVDGVRGAGRHEAVLDGARLPGGAYVVRLEAGSFVQTTRVVLLR